MTKTKTTEAKHVANISNGQLGGRPRAYRPRWYVEATTAEEDLQWLNAARVGLGCKPFASVEIALRSEERAAVLRAAEAEE